MIVIFHNNCFFYESFFPVNSHFSFRSFIPSIFNSLLNKIALETLFISNLDCLGLQVVCKLLTNWRILFDSYMIQYGLNLFLQ